MATILYLVGGKFKSPEEAKRREKIANTFLADPVNNRVIMEEVGYGPSSIESAAEGDIELPGAFCKAIRDSQMSKMDAIVIGCGDDPGLYSMRELLDIPVIGMTEASAAFASMLGERFTMITTGEECVPETRLQFKKYGIMDKCASVRYVSFSVLDMQRGVVSREDVVSKFNAEVELARQDGASAVLMGCGTMAFLLLDEDANKQSSIPVLNPAKIGIRTAEMLVSMRLSHSKSAYPKPAQLQSLYKMMLDSELKSL